MESLTLQEDVIVVGFPVTTFPNGIGEAFARLQKSLPEASTRSYYGIVLKKEHGMVYVATARQKEEDEAQKFHYRQYRVVKGDYFVTRVREWHQKTAVIKDIFSEMLKAPSIDASRSCVEWYRNADEMLCMVPKAD